jgi:LmbE family N-acetylglucosaminyl deacetylase
MTAATAGRYGPGTGGAGAYAGSHQATDHRGTGRDRLPNVSSVLAVCAHPDDESFGLGAVLDSFVLSGASVSVLCFTRGEASTLGDCRPEDLGELRRSELHAAAAQLGVGRVELFEYPDGSLAGVALGQLTGEVTAMAAEVGADLLLVFDEGGITGHPDHRRATEAALGALELPVLAWAIPRSVADTLNSELGSTFVGRSADEIDMVVRVPRSAQDRAIA